MKKTNIILLMFSFLLFSCSNINVLNEHTESSDQFASVNIFIKGLNDNSRTAMSKGPTVSGDLKIRIYYKKVGDNDYTVLGEFGIIDNINQRMSSLGLYYFKAECYDPADPSKILYHTISNNVVDLNAYGQHDVILSMSTYKVIDYSSNGNGSISLAVKTDSSITKCVVNWTQDGQKKSQSFEITSGQGTFYVSSIKNGNYEMEFRFYNSTGALLYRIPCEAVNVAKGCTTDCWVASGEGCEYFSSEDNKTVMNIKGNLLYTNDISITAIYVDSNKTENGTGVKHGPFNDINEAVATACSMSKVTTVNIAKGSRFTILKPINITKTLTLQPDSYTTGQTPIIYRKSGTNAFSDDSMIKTSGTGTISINNIILDGNNVAVQSNGAGIYSTASVVNLQNVTIQNCKIKSGSGKSGNSIYSTGQIKFNQSTSITSDIYLSGSDGQISFDGKFTTNPNLQITPSLYTNSTQVIKFSSGQETNYGDDFAGYCAVTKENGSTEWYVLNNGKISKEGMQVSVLAKKLGINSPTVNDCSKIQVTSADDFKQILKWSKSGSLTNIFIDWNISSDTFDISSISGYTGLGSETYPFQGIFDGNNKKFILKDSALVDCLGNTGLLENLTVTGSASTAGLVKIMKGGKLYNCYGDHLAINVTNTSNALKVGGLIGEMNGGTIEKCEINYSDITASGNLMHKTGGIVGYVNATGSNVTITDCKRKAGSISGTGSFQTPQNGTGGIVGFVEGTKEILISNCTNYPPVSGKANVGGIIGKSSSGHLKIYNSGNEGSANISSNAADTSGGDFGGIAGSIVSNDIIDLCYNHAQVSGISYYAGGICGECSGVVRNSINTGNVTLDKGNGAGGIVGSLAVKNANGIFNCYNKGKISAKKQSTSARAGGIIGQIERASDSDWNIQNCVNTGDVESDVADNAGGIVGGCVTGNETPGSNCKFNYFESTGTTSQPGCPGLTEGNAKTCLFPMKTNSLTNGVMTCYDTSGSSVTALLNAWVTNNNVPTEIYKKWLYVSNEKKYEWLSN